MSRPRPSLSPALRLAAWAAALLATIGTLRAAEAGDVRPVEIPLASGAVIKGSVESADGREVVLRVGPDEVRRIPWTQLSPLGLFRAKAALAPPADGEARLEIAELAADLGLWAETRAEYEKAFALGALDKRRFGTLVADAERRAVEQGLAHARLAAEAGDFDAAMDVARRLKLEFTNAPNAALVDRMIDDLLAQVKSLDAEAAKAAAELQKAMADLARNQEIAKRMARAATLVDEAKEDAKKSADLRAKGNVSGARKAAEAADDGYMAARKDLGRLRRILPKDHPQRAEALASLAELDRIQFDLRFGMAKFLWDQRIYSQAEEWANKAAYLDPVQPDLVELRDLLRENRIRYRVSDVTNAHPIVR